MLYTFQDFEKETDKAKAVSVAIQRHLNSDLYKTAIEADAYDHQKNTTIYNYVQMIFSLTGTPIEDFTASNNKIASNFFHRLNSQRCAYLLGNGVSFTENVEVTTDEDGIEVSTDRTKETLGAKFDTDLKKITYDALIHGVAFGFWNVDRMHVFPVTQFVPIWDEDTGALRAGVRFWQIDKNKPMVAVLYEENGYTRFKAKNGLDFTMVEDRKSYKTFVQVSEVDGEEVIGEENYGSLPIVPIWGSDLKQSTLVGMRSSIDSFDLIRSGFANDLSDCAQIYWILENCGGMTDDELARFRDRLKLNHIAVADTVNSKVVPYTQEVPYNARKEYLDMIRSGIYEDFGGLDVHTIAAGATNDHIDAAYQPLDEEADLLEYQVIEFIQQILKLIGIKDTPIFKRNRISNQSEQTQMILSSADHLDNETVLRKLPFISVDEISRIMARKTIESEEAFEKQQEIMSGQAVQNTQEDEEEQ